MNSVVHRISLVMNSATYITISYFLTANYFINSRKEVILGKKVSNCYAIFTAIWRINSYCMYMVIVHITITYISRKHIATYVCIK